MARIDAVMAVPALFLLNPMNLAPQLVEIPLERPLPPIEVGLCTRAEGRLTPLAITFSRAVVDLTRQAARAKQR